MNTMEQLINQDEFLTKYNILKEDFEKTTLTWEGLREIYKDYCKIRPDLDNALTPVVNTLMKVKYVHSVRYRTKDPEHLIEKIVRKRIEKPERVITIANYQDEMTDLIGIRVMHLFKIEWEEIHRSIMLKCTVKGKPINYYREGDPPQHNLTAKANGCKNSKHQYGYRSVHYIIKTKPQNKMHYIELQVRTIFEEGWSEIDHTIRYPYDQNHPVCGPFLSILNRLAGSADEMGTFVSFLKDYHDATQKLHKQQIAQQEDEQEKKDKEIMELKNKIKRLGVTKEVKKEIIDDVERIQKPQVYNIISNSFSDVFEAARAVKLVSESFHKNLAAVAGSVITFGDATKQITASLTKEFSPLTLPDVLKNLNNTLYPLPSITRICNSCGKQYTKNTDKPTNLDICESCEARNVLPSSSGAQ